MENLNELVELAKKATSGKWIADSGEGWDAIISQQDMANANFIIGEFIGPDSKANKEFVSAANPEAILAIAEAFRALEQASQKNLDGALAWQQRAEHAEHALKDANVCIVAAEQEIADLNAELSAAEAKLAEVEQQKAQWVAWAKEGCAEADRLKAKLAELEKQEPVGYHRGEARAVFRVWHYADGDICVPVYSRPVPAITLAELVPGERPVTNEKLLCDNIENNGWNLCRAAILRNIEEQSQ